MAAKGIDMAMALDHIILKVNDRDASIAFYRDVLGFDYVGEREPFSVIRVNDCFAIQLAPWGSEGGEHLAFALTQGEFDTALGRLQRAGIDFSFWALLHSSLLGFGMHHGLSATRRLLRLSAEYTDLEREVTGGVPHWYVHMMGIAPKLQGRGLGAKLLDLVLEEQTDGRSDSIALNTNNFENVRFYSRAGFRVVDKRDMPDASERGVYPCWSMSRSGPYVKPETLDVADSAGARGGGADA
jgi:ribosomal protein S18 acetylase RimI-like enzyme